MVYSKLFSNLMGKQSIRSIILLIMIALLSSCSESPTAVGEPGVEDITPPPPPPPPPLPPPPPPPACNCYYNADCVGGTIGLRVCIVGSCAVGVQPSGKINDGICTFFVNTWSADPQKSNDAAKVFEANINEWHKAAESGGKPSASVIEQARDQVPKDISKAMEALAYNTLLLVVGRADYNDDHPHRPGSFYRPIRIDELGRLDPVDKPTLAVLEFVGSVLTDHLRHGVALSPRLDAIRTLAPDYSGHGNCQYPHPSKNHHEFLYEDAFDCVIKEILHAVNPQELLPIKTEEPLSFNDG